MDGESYRNDGSLFTRFLSSRQRLKWLVRSRNARFPFRGATGWLVKISRSKNFLVSWTEGEGGRAAEVVVVG